jgi:mannonate dehydratase
MSQKRGEIAMTLITRRGLMGKIAEAALTVFPIPFLSKPAVISATPTQKGGVSAHHGHTPESKMRVLMYPKGGVSESGLRYIKQLGVNDVGISASWVPGYKEKGHMELENLLSVKNQVEQLGLRLGSVYLEKLDTANLLLDRPGWKKDLDNVCRTIDCMGKAAIPVLNHSLLVSRVIRDTTGQPLPGYWINPNGRGGARLLSFDAERAKQVTDEPAGSVSADQMWERITRFQERCVPVATECKVHLACHPDDPPVARHWGVTQALNSVEGLDRLLAIVPSPYNGVLLCLGTMQASGTDVLQAIRHFGRRGKIFELEFRNVRGKVPKFDEPFLDEGDLDMWKVVQTLKEIDYQGTIEIGHYPEILGDTEEASTSRAWAIGYLKGLIAAANAASTN